MCLTNLFKFIYFFEILTYLIFLNQHSKHELTVTLTKKGNQVAIIPNNKTLYLAVFAFTVQIEPLQIIFWKVPRSSSPLFR